MQIGQHETVQEFLDRAGPFLARTEAENSLLLGICSDLLTFPDRFEFTPLLLTVRRESDAIAAALMTPPYDLVLTRLPSDAAEPLAQYLAGRDVCLPGVVGPSPETGAFAECWAAQAGKSCRPGMRQRLYQCERVVPPDRSPGRLRPATDADVPLLARWRREYRREVGFEEDEDHRAIIQNRIARRQLYVWEHDRVVSMACSGGRTAHGVRVFLVYTPPDLRRRGYATSCVASLTERLLESGRTYCFLAADLANPTSNQIYQKIGYQPVCDWQVWRFE